MAQSNSDKKRIEDAINRARELTKQSDSILSSSTSLERDIRSRRSEKKLDESLRELRNIARKTRGILADKG